MTPGILGVHAGDPGSLAEWQALFAPLLPHLRVVHLDDPAVPVAEIRHAFVWRPTPGRLAALPRLGLIVSSGAGVDGIVSDPSWPSHVPLVRMGGAETVQRMTEYVCLGALALLRDLPRMIAGQRACRWDSFDPPRCAPDTTVGVMGLGNLGAAAAARLRLLGFPVLGWSRTPKRIDGVECLTSLDGFLPRVDILVCLLPDTPDTRGVVDAGLLRRLPRGARLLNAARGAHVVVPDLLAALDDGHIDSAMLDVFDPEPLPPDSPLWRHPRVVVTPHTASTASLPQRARYVADAIAAFERGDALPNLYDPARGY